MAMDDQPHRTGLCRHSSLCPYRAAIRSRCRREASISGVTCALALRVSARRRPPRPLDFTACESRFSGGINDLANNDGVIHTALMTERFWHGRRAQRRGGTRVKCRPREASKNQPTNCQLRVLGRRPTLREPGMGTHRAGMASQGAWCAHSSALMLACRQPAGDQDVTAIRFLSRRSFATRPVRLLEAARREAIAAQQTPDSCCTKACILASDQ